MAFKLTTLATGLALAGLAGAAFAQTPPAPERITITGSSIKRIATEGALPITVISRAELDRQGITSAEQVILNLSTNGNGLDNLASNADVVGGAQRGNNGATSANLRGQGSNATLILLNGRRVAAHGLNGGVVDLNQIPMAAIERIEILKDGASAIYGTDAIGGVINFILRTNFRGGLVRASADVTEAGGGNIYSGAVAGGFGDLDKDGFNLLGTLSVREHKALRGDERAFVNTFQPNRGLSVDTRGTPFATIFPLAGTLFPTNAAFPNIPGTTTPASGGLNILDLPGQPGCGSIAGQAPYDELLWNVPSAGLACAWDTGRAAVLQQPVTSTNLVLRGTLMFGEHLLAAEVTASRTESAKRFSNLQLTPNTTTQQLRYPRNTASQASYDAVFDALRAAFPANITEAQRGQPLAYRWRCIECGPREIDTEADTRRFALTAEGPLFGGWDYRAGVLQATSEAKSTLGGGYYFRGTTGTGASDGGPGIIPALNSGRINIFLFPGQTQSADGRAALEEASARGVVLYGGEFTVTQTDFSASGPVFKLPAGDVMAAVGVDLRSEEYKFNGDERDAAAQRVIIAAPFDQANVLSGAKRDVTAVYGELLVPVVKGLELTLAVRQDKYDGFGTTTNPKVSALWKPNDSLLLRGSYSTGFRVPTFNQLFNGSSESLFTGTTLVDPLTCPGGRPNTTDPGCAFIDRAANIINGGKPDLGPEEAEMASLGFIWEPTRNFSVGMDWWTIERTGTIQILSLTQLIDNYRFFPERFIRDGTGRLIGVDQRWVNAGSSQTEGVEVNLRGGFDALGARWTAGLEGTYLLKKRSRVVPGVPYGPSEIGQFSFAGDLGLRWKHNAAINYRRGDWSATLSQFYRSGYNDQVLPGVAAGRVSPRDWKPKVDSYTVYNVGLSWTGIKGLTINGIVKNVFDEDPPFAITYDSNFGSGSSWEPRVADPRGRSFVLSAEYRF
ncbi:MAG: TonB-dependent receptor domain-containing protein [Betaproteobacteria bacterium]|jgi:iron complex outermembrane receptor protein|nr:TonB-dependent receptor [Rubrivivax sp.]